MLINLRNALMGGKRLPYDAEVEYLQSSGTQWIDTGTPIAYSYRIELTFATTASGTQYIFGDSISGSALYRWAQTSANKFAIMTGNGSAIGTPPSISTNTVYTARVENKVCYLNDVQFATIAGTDPSTPRTAHAYLFTWNAATISGGKLRLYSCKIYDEDGVLVRDFIPVRKGTVGYLYDRVSGKLFGNAGTGDFVVGPDVVPVEYIESHGTEWIDTGFKASNSTRVAVYFELTSSTLNKWILGARNGTSSATDKFALFCGNSSYAMIGSAMGEFSGATIKTGRHLLDMSLAGGVVVDSQIVATYSASEQAEVFSATYAMALFNLWNGSLNSPFIGKYYACDFWDNGDPVRKFRPVRVGTEGAMMDVLTRRIYRNQGTGAFTYGNDLKYPIPAS